MKFCTHLKNIIRCRSRRQEALSGIATLLLGALLVTAAGCERGATQQRPPPPSVTVARVEQKEIVEQQEFTGRIEPVESVEIRPKISGYIEEVKFQSGQLVKKGDVLFVIDSRWHQAAFNQRQGEFEQAEVRLENASREADRTPQLLTNRAISVEEADARQSRYQEAKAALLAAQAALQSATLDLDNTQVRAPIAGRVSRALRTEGNYVNGGTGDANILTTLVSVDPVYAYVDMDENSLLKFNALARSKKFETDGEDQIPADLELGDETDFPHHGHIESFDNRLSAETGSILLRAVFTNPDGRIVPGLFARVRVPLSERHRALLVEEKAIGTDQAQKFVLALTATNTVAYRHVELGGAVDGRRIIRSGLEGDEEIVVNGLARVRPGMAVAPQQAVAGVSTPNLAHR
jgi:RND family efflux transporter MFP subunit